MASGAEHLAPGLHEYLISHSTAPDALLDLAFVDADKAGYAAYWEEIVPRTRPGGVIVVDNTLLHGRISTPSPIPMPLRSGSSTSMCSPTTGSSMSCSRSETA